VRLLIDVVENENTGRAKRVAPIMIANPMTSLCRRINVSSSIRWRASRQARATDDRCDFPDARSSRSA
jgi:hypothetical protein